MDRRYKHGHCISGLSPEYISWRHMVARCCNPKRDKDKYWGGRGIKVCEEWKHDFKAFLDYIGPKPTPKHTIDRYPDNNGNYEPGNVRWATMKEQRANQRSARPKLQQQMLLKVLEDIRKLPRKSWIRKVYTYKTKMWRGGANRRKPTRPKSVGKPSVGIIPSPPSMLE